MTTELDFNPLASQMLLDTAANFSSSSNNHMSFPKVVEPIPYTNHLPPMKENTIREYNLDKHEAEKAMGHTKHRFNFIDQNKILAVRYRDHLVL